MSRSMLMSVALNLARSGILLPIVVYFAAAGSAYSADWNAAPVQALSVAHEQSARAPN